MRQSFYTLFKAIICRQVVWFPVLNLSTELQNRSYRGPKDISEKTAIVQYKLALATSISSQKCPKKDDFRSQVRPRVHTRNIRFKSWILDPLEAMGNTTGARNNALSKWTQSMALNNIRQ